MSGIRGKSFCFTFNNYTPEDEVRIQGIECVYIVYGREVGESGTPHLQGYIRFLSQKAFNVVRRLLSPAHVENAVTTTAAIEYCKKDGDVFEKGIQPVGREAGRRKGNEVNAQRFEDAYCAAREGRMDDIPAEFKFKYGNALKRIRYEFQEASVPEAIPVLDNHWFWGPSGLGKSVSARHEFPGAYIKMRNKWWDKYNFEDVVIIDDVDPTMEAWLTGFLKDWADHHKFRCETKGSSVAIRPKQIIVTSQYDISECFKDPRTVEAIQRRFQVRRFGPGYFVPELMFPEEAAVVAAGFEDGEAVPAVVLADIAACNAQVPDFLADMTDDELEVEL